MKKFLPLLLIALMTLVSCKQEAEWISLFDGESLEGWTPSENKDSWEVRDGLLITAGERSHLFYTGEVSDAEFRNFELYAEVKVTPGSNSGIYIHTEYQEEGWPSKGYECQVSNTSFPRSHENNYVERKKTGSIYGVRNVWKQVVADDQWFEYRILVQGKTIRTYINGLLTAAFTEPNDPSWSEFMGGRVLSSGTIGLQCHDPDSEVSYRNIRIRLLDDELESPGTPSDDLEFEKQLIELSRANFPLVDLHTHLKGGLSREDALAHARHYGYSYGIAVNCGLKMGFESDAELQEYLDGFEPDPRAWHAMQAEGREWLELFSPESRERFDYVFTDAMTWTNSRGVRQRLWIPEETDVGDPQDFMEQLVGQIEKVLTEEPVDIYVNPTYLPAELADRYDELWTEERMDRVVAALVEGGVALEINNRLSWPSAALIKKAKAAGVKFTFGTNNAGADDLGRMDYALEMIRICDLKPGNMWLPE